MKKRVSRLLKQRDEIDRKLTELDNKKEDLENIKMYLQREKENITQLITN
ncbi:hypothetical protein J4217_03550 [Candidatus Pacearchaeota archaeon]|nr:hypothetical protein [uncultured archaeon]MBS3091494.1 hypothetical protein [Candidatus Pacearchaeota archaeon]